MTTRPPAGPYMSSGWMRWIDALAMHGRLGPFCIFPRPPGWTVEDEIEPVDPEGQRPTLPISLPRQEQSQ